MADETTIFNVSQVLTAATKPLDELYKKHCPLDSELCTRAVAVVRECIEMTFIPKMEELDDLFGNLYSKIHHAGSYYDGLRIVKPTEFDLDIMLKMPFPKHLMKLDFGNSFPIPSGFARYYRSSPPKDVKTTKKLTKDQERLFLTFSMKIFYFQLECVIGSEQLLTKQSVILSSTRYTICETR